MRIRLYMLLLFLACAGCATQSGDSPEANDAMPGDLRVTLVTAHGVGSNNAPLGVADYFTYDGRLVAYASFTWTKLDYSWGKQKVSFHWYNGDRLIRKADVDANFGKPPHHVWSVSQPTSMGAGNCRVEVYWRGQKLAERTFRVIDATAPENTSPGKGV